jgi:hypothetical protein
MVPNLNVFIMNHLTSWFHLKLFQNGNHFPGSGEPGLFPIKSTGTNRISQAIMHCLPGISTGINRLFVLHPVSWLHEALNIIRHFNPSGEFRNLVSALWRNMPAGLLPVYK